MRYVRHALLVVAAGLGLAVGSPAQDKGDEITTGFRAFVVAEPRFPPPEFRDRNGKVEPPPLGPDGKPIPRPDVRNRAGKMPDLVTEHGLNPVVAVFSRTVPAEADNPLVAVVRKTDKLVADNKARKLGAFLVFLTLPDEYRKADKDNTRDAKVKEVEQWVNGAKPTKTTVALAEATVKTDADTLVPEQVTKMGIEAEDDLVIVFYHQYRVVKRWKYKVGTAPTEADLAALSDEVAKVVGKK